MQTTIITTAYPSGATYQRERRNITHGQVFTEEIEGEATCSIGLVAREIGPLDCAAFGPLDEYGDEFTDTGADYYGDEH